MPAPDDKCRLFDLGQPISDWGLQGVAGNMFKHHVQQSLAAFGLCKNNLFKLAWNGPALLHHKRHKLIHISEFAHHQWVFTLGNGFLQITFFCANNPCIIH